MVTIYETDGASQIVLRIRDSARAMYWIFKPAHQVTVAHLHDFHMATFTTYIVGGIFYFAFRQALTDATY